MEISDLIINPLIAGIVGFFLGILFHEDTKNWLYYRFLKSPLKLSSQQADNLGPLYHGPMNVGDMFIEEINIMNVSRIPIWIERMEVIMKFLNWKGSKIRRMTFWFQDYGRLLDAMEQARLNPFGGIEDLKSVEYPTEQRVGTNFVGQNTVPMLLKPNEHKKLYFGMLGLVKGKSIESMVTIYPICEYKKPKLSYNLIFAQKT